MKENDLRTAAFVIEVFGEELVSRRLYISLRHDDTKGVKHQYFQ